MLQILNAKDRKVRQGLLETTSKEPQTTNHRPQTSLSRQFPSIMIFCTHQCTCTVLLKFILGCIPEYFLSGAVCNISHVCIDGYSCSGFDRTMKCLFFSGL